MAVTRASMYFMERRRILTGSRHRPTFTCKGTSSHRRPVEYLPDMLQADTPQSRVLTQKQTERVPYIGQEQET